MDHDHDTMSNGSDLTGERMVQKIDLGSIETGNEPRDNHLRSADYFEVEKYPTMSSRSIGIRRTDDGWGVDGELTSHGVTRRVPLAVEANGFGPDPFGGRRAGFSATAEVNHRDVAIGDDHPDGRRRRRGRRQVSISLEIEAVFQKQPTFDRAAAHRQPGLSL